MAREWENGLVPRGTLPGTTVCSAGGVLRRTARAKESNPMGKRVLSAAIAAAALLAASAASASTLDDVRNRGVLDCGVNQGLPGFAVADEKGNWTGFDVDFCRAVAAAVLGDATKVKLVPLTAKERLEALATGKVDLLTRGKPRNATWSAGGSGPLPLISTVTTYFDGQGFMINTKKLTGVNSALQLSGASICVNAETTSALNVADYFRSKKMEYQLVKFEKSDEAAAAYDNDQCQVYSTDLSGLYAQRLKLKTPADHAILPEIISKDPLGPIVRQGDDQWLNVVKWTHYAMVDAEEDGVTSTNVDEMKKSDNPEIRRLLGIEGSFGIDLGLSTGWAYDIVKQVGNYGEIFEKNVGPATPLGIARGVNALWTKGGLQYAPPIR